MAHILIVDDDDPFRSALRATLLRMGHSVSEAANGAIGWERFRDGGADVVLMDLIMPEKEGLETIRLFHRNRCTVKIIAMSGGGRTDARDLLKTAVLFGADAVLPKPFSQGELAATLDRVLARQSAAPMPGDQRPN